jgi:hypothetical protein
LFVVFLLLLLVVPVLADDRLAILATNMQPLGGESYTMECGPVAQGDSVITNPVAKVQGQEYCVMRRGGDTIFGTYLLLEGAYDSKEIVVPLLEAYSDGAYYPHIDGLALGDFEEFCDRYDIAKTKFQPCDRIETAGRDIFPYMYIGGNLDDPVAFFILSDVSLPEIDPTVFSTITNFFKSIFGFGTTPPPFIESGGFQEFHHAYFAQEGDRSVVATWQGRKATIIYQNFVTDMSVLIPKNRAAVFSLGTDAQQVIEGITLSPSLPADALLWRRYTTGLRINDGVEGTPATGVCGGPDKGGPYNNQIVVNFDEECEPTIELDATTCANKGFQSGTATCKADCTIDTSSCIICVDLDGDEAINDTASTCPDIPATRIDCDDTNVSIHPLATEILGNGEDDDCNPATSDTVPPPELICNYDGIEDDGESEVCRDRQATAGACPTALVEVGRQGKYSFEVRSNVTNQPELVITLTPYAAECQLSTGGDTLTSQLRVGSAGGYALIFEDPSGHQIWLNMSGHNWTVEGNASAPDDGSTVLKDCWGTEFLDGRSFKHEISKNLAPFCTSTRNCLTRGSACGFNSDCCHYQTASWCEVELNPPTCQRDYYPPCEPGIEDYKDRCRIPEYQMVT